MLIRFWGIFWVDGRSKGSITDGFAGIAQKCGHQDESLEGVMMWLQTSPHTWLLILDNADNKDLDMGQFLPAGIHGSILITTRLTECAKLQNVGKDHYERLDEETAIDLLLKACDIENSAREEHENHAREIVEILGCHALAVIQAGAAISQGLCNLEKYNYIFRFHRQDLLECFPEQARSEYGGVYATFEVTAKYLEDRDDQTAKDALGLLNFYAFMHFSDFPEVAFEEAWKNSMYEHIVSSDKLPDGEENIQKLAPWHVEHLPTFMQKSRHDNNLDKLRLDKARSLLTSLSLVTFDSAREMTHMHPVSHFWARDRLRRPELWRNAILTGTALLSLSIEDSYAEDPSPLSIQLQSHIESIAHSLNEWDNSPCEFHLQQSIYRLGLVLYRLGYDSTLIEFLRMLPIKEDVVWLTTENGDAIQWLHGACLLAYGDAEGAVVVREQLNKGRTETLKAENPKVLLSQQQLASAYLAINDTTKAIPMLEKICRTQNELLSSDDQARLASLHELASAYLRIEETTKAIKILKEVVEIRAKMLRPEHPNLLVSQHELGRAYLAANETDKAIALLEKVEKIKQRTMRPEHTDRLKSQHELARAYLEVNETDKAIALLEEVVKIRQRTMRPEHTDRLLSQHELARAYLDANETDKAISILEEVVEIRAGTLREGHPDRVTSINVLSVCYYYAKNYERALELARSIEGVAQNRGGERIADWNGRLIGFILEDMNMGKEDKEGDDGEEEEGKEEQA